MARANIRKLRAPRPFLSVRALSRQSREALGYKARTRSLVQGDGLPPQDSLQRYSHEPTLKNEGWGTRKTKSGSLALESGARDDNNLTIRLYERFFTSFRKITKDLKLDTE